MENAENSFKIDVIQPVIRPFIQEDMTLWWIRDEMLSFYLIIYLKTSNYTFFMK